ncbi:MAG: YihY/virulence factor BrkB family protein [Thermoleophilaceae bacterium]
MAQPGQQAAASGDGRAHRWRPRRRRPKPSRFADLPDGAWGRIARRTFDKFQENGVTNLAAALTYRAVLSLFPGLIALIALLGVFGEYPRTFDAVLAILGRLMPQPTVQTLTVPLRGVIANKGGSDALLGVGLAGALWGSSGYVGAFSWATNVLWEAPRGRSWYRQWPFNLLVTVVSLFLLTFVMSALVLSGPIATAVGAQLGVGPDALAIWNVAKWPAILIVVTLMVSGLYYVAPNVRPPSPKWLTPGAILAVATWALASAGFGLFLANFGSYNKTYGTLGAIITFLVWIWLTNTAMLLGVELDSEIERERQIVAGETGDDDSIELPLRQS